MNQFLIEGLLLFNVSHNCTAFVKVLLLLVVDHVEDLRRVPELNTFSAFDIFTCD